MPLHLLPLYAPYPQGRLKNVEELMMDIMTLPIDSGLADSDGRYVIDHLLDSIRKARKSQWTLNQPNYGFNGRLMADFPSQVIIDITEVCNLECIHCPHPEFKKSKYYDARYLDPVINAKAVNKIRNFPVRGGLNIFVTLAKGSLWFIPKAMK